jgi:hypothetical protein
MSTNDLSGRFSENSPGSPPSGSPGPPAPPLSSKNLFLENLTEEKGNTQKSIPNTQELENTQKSTSDTQISVLNVEFPLSGACKGVITTTAEFGAIFDSSGIGKSQNRSEMSINSETKEYEFKEEKITDTREENFHVTISNDKNFATTDNQSTTTIKRYIAPDIDVYMEGEKGRSRRPSLDFNYIPEPPPKKPVNPRILILDFKEKSVENIKIVRNALIMFTEIRNFSIKRLSRGGISILFAKPKAREFAEAILLEKLSDQLITRGGFIRNKKVFEIACNVPKEVNLDTLNAEIRSISYKKLGYRTIFTLSTAVEASRLIADGYFFENFHLEFAPFVYKPKVACKCGSIYHSTCTPDPNITETENTICGNCKQQHPTKDCEMLKMKMKSAMENKKKSYADALKVGIMTAPAPPPKVTSSLELSPTLILDIVSLVLKHFKIEINMQEVKEVISTALSCTVSAPGRPQPSTGRPQPAPTLTKPVSQVQINASSNIPEKNAVTTTNKKKKGKKPKKEKSKYSLPTETGTTAKTPVDHVLAVLAEKETIQASEAKEDLKESMEIETSRNEQENSDVEIESASPEPSDYETDKRLQRTRTSSRGRGGKPFISKVQREFEQIEKEKEKAPPQEEDLSHVVYPRCWGCGEKYQMTEAWKKHICEGEEMDGNSHYIKCFCKKQVKLTKENYEKTVASFHEHLIHKCLRYK